MQKGKRGGGGPKEHRRRTVLPSIIDGHPACMCGAKHVLKPVFRSVPRTACVRIGSGYPHDSIPAPSLSSSGSFNVWALSRRRLRLEAATSARRGCGPDRIRVYLRHILGVRHVAVGRATRAWHACIIALSPPPKSPFTTNRSTTSSRRHGNITIKLSLSINTRYNSLQFQINILISRSAPALKCV